MRGSTAGIGDGLRGTSSIYYKIITFLDQLISIIVVAPLVVAYWRGTWSCMDILVSTDALAALISVAIGFIGSLFFTLSQNLFMKHFHKNINRIKYYIMTRLYTSCFGIVCVNQFRGPWLCLDLFTPLNIHSVLTITIVSIIILMCTKTLRNLSAPPFALTVDRYEDYFAVPTFLKHSSDRLWVYLLDCLFSICVIGTLVVFVWRGTWCLLDLLLFPDNPVTSACASAIIGYSLVIITFSLQSFMKSFAKNSKGIIRLMLVDIYLLLSFCGTVNVWRGIWNLLNHYFLPGWPNTSYILTHLGSFLILMLINASNSILVRGVYLDGEEKGDLCVDFPCYYLRLILQKRKERRFLRECEKKRTGGKHNGEVESEAILSQDSKKPIIVPMNKNNNEISNLI